MHVSFGRDHWTLKLSCSFRKSASGAGGRHRSAAQEQPPPYSTATPSTNLPDKEHTYDSNDSSPFESHLASPPTLSGQTVSPHTFRQKIGKYHLILSICTTRRDTSPGMEKLWYEHRYQPSAIHPNSIMRQSSVMSQRRAELAAEPWVGHKRPQNTHQHPGMNHTLPRLPIQELPAEHGPYELPTSQDDEAYADSGFVDCDIQGLGPQLRRHGAQYRRSCQSRSAHKASFSKEASSGMTVDTSFDGSARSLSSGDSMSPAQYVPQYGEYGYGSSHQGQNISPVSFSGNSTTPSSYADTVGWDGQGESGSHSIYQTDVSMTTTPFGTFRHLPSAVPSTSSFAYDNLPIQTQRESLNHVYDDSATALPTPESNTPSPLSQRFVELERRTAQECATNTLCGFDNAQHTLPWDRPLEHTHRLQQDMQLNQASQQSQLIRPISYCNFCSTAFHGKHQGRNLKRHIENLTCPNLVGYKLPCRIPGCDKSYKRSDARKKHEWKEHRHPEAAPTKRKERNKGRRGHILDPSHTIEVDADKDFMI